MKKSYKIDVDCAACALKMEDAAKAMSITLIKEETEEPEKAADHLAINTVRIGGEEMK